MIKIVHIARPISGVGVYIDLLTKYIDDNKFTNVLICNTEDDLIKPRNKSGNKIKIHHANLFRKINPNKDLKVLISIIKIIKNEQPDMNKREVCKRSLLLSRSLQFCQEFLLLHYDNVLYLSQKNKIKRSIYKLIEKTISNLPAKTLACSTSEYNRAVKELKINKKKVRLWNNSIEEHIDLTSIDIPLDLPEKYICTIGRPSYQKNTELLINSIIDVKTQIKDIHLIILGAGLYSPSLEKINK